MKIDSISVSDKAAKVILKQLRYEPVKTVVLAQTKQEAKAGKPGQEKKTKVSPEEFLKAHLVNHLSSIYSDAMHTAAHDELLKEAKARPQIS